MTSLFDKVAAFFNDSPKQECRGCKQQNEDDDEYEEDDEDEEDEYESEDDDEAIKIENIRVNITDDDSHTNLSDSSDNQYEDDDNDNNCSQDDDDNDDMIWYNELLEERQQQQYELMIQKQSLQNQTIRCLQNQQLYQMHQKQQYGDVLKQLIDKKQQLQYLEIVNSMHCEPTLLIQEIQLQCLVDPSRVAIKLQSDKYPIEVISITQKYNIQEGTAILYHRQSDMESCLKQYQQLIDDLMRQYVREHLRLPVQVNKNRRPIIIINNIEQLLQTIQQLLDKMQRFVLSDNMCTDLDIHWYSIFHKVVEWQQWLQQVQKLPGAKKDIIQLIHLFRLNTPNIVLNIVHNSDIDLFIDEIESNYANLNIAAQNYCFSQVTSHLRYYRNILTLGVSEILRTHDMVFDILRYYRSKGKRVEIQCEYCKLLAHMIPIGQSELQSAIRLKCGHTYHKTCLDIAKQCVICNVNLIDIYIRIQQNLIKTMNKLHNQIEQQLITIQQESTSIQQTQTIIQTPPPLPPQTISKQQRYYNKLQQFDKHQNIRQQRYKLYM